MIQQTAEDLVAFYLGRRCRLDGVIEAQRDVIADSLMWPSCVMMFFDREQAPAQVRLAQQYQIVEGLTNFAYVSFRVGVAERRMRGRLADAQGVAFQNPIQGSEAGVPVMDQIPARQFPILHRHREVPGLLCHPGGVRLGGATGQPHPASAQVDEEQNIKGDQPTQGSNFFGEEIGRPSHLQVRLEELLPRRAFAIGDRGQALTPEHVAHVAGTGLVAEFS